MAENQERREFLSHVHPYDSLPPEQFDQVADLFATRKYKAGQRLYGVGDELDGLYVVVDGRVSITDKTGNAVSILGPRNSFGERGLSRGGIAATNADAQTELRVLILPPEEFRNLIAQFPSFQKFFDRTRPVDPSRQDIAAMKVADLMAKDPVDCPPQTESAMVAKIMRDKQISCLGVSENDALVGIVTATDLVNRLVAKGLPATTPVSQVMTRDPMSLPSTALGSDVLHMMVENGFGHTPIIDAGAFVGIVTQTDLVRAQAMRSATLVQAVANAETVGDLVQITSGIPDLLVQLVSSGNRHETVTRIITDVSDACTRRLLKMAQDKLGPAPVKWLWLACGSQGRQEQTGVSDQDNCLFLDDSVRDDDMAYFAAMAKFVSDGLDACGYVYCPGDMMATNPRWCQPVSVWRGYFQGWIDKPDPEAQMLASVMYDLRPIGGETSLFQGLQAETLEATARNSIFMAHMASNALKHTPPLGLLRGIATIRSGEHKHQIDMKHSGVVPVVDLGRIYALQGQLGAVNTRARLEAAASDRVVSPGGARDLIDAYDLIAQMRLEHQVALIKEGKAPDNYLSPAALSDFERSHLRDAFVVIRTMQSALGHGRAAPA